MVDVFKRRSFPGRFDWWREFNRDTRASLRRRARRRLRQELNAGEPSVEEALIVKVQTALDDPSHPALIYDRERSFHLFVPAEQVLARMAGRIKVYFHAWLRDGKLGLGEEAPEQDW